MVVASTSELHISSHSYTAFERSSAYSPVQSYQELVPANCPVPIYITEALLTPWVGVSVDTADTQITIANGLNVGALKNVRNRCFPSSSLVFTKYRFVDVLWAVFPIPGVAIENDFSCSNAVTARSSCTSTRVLRSRAPTGG